MHEQKLNKLPILLLLASSQALAGAYKCPLPDGTFSFQQQPCTITTGDQNKIDAKPLPGTGEGLRDGERDMLYDIQAQKVEEARRRMVAAEARVRALQYRDAMDIERRKIEAQRETARAIRSLGMRYR